MKKWVKRLVIGLIIIACVFAFSAKFLLTKELLVEQAEDAINSRVQIGSFEVSLFSFPAKVTLRDVILAERDNYANRKVAYAEREPIATGALSCDVIRFDVSLWELLSRKIYVDTFEADGFHAKVSLYEDGTNSLNALFADPHEPVPDAVAEPPSFNAKRSEEFVTQLDSIRITDASFDLLIEKTGVLVSGQGCQVLIDDIEVNPNSLEVVNEQRFS
ncbi:hypothetical protein [Rubritalea tangerina]|uniref:hypothetical protein n=1 Tax=Rubritalea tangerina TaxID=430798 RepID=UPI003605E627